MFTFVFAFGFMFVFAFEFACCPLFAFAFVFAHRRAVRFAFTLAFGELMLGLQTCSQGERFTFAERRSQPTLLSGMDTIICLAGEHAKVLDVLRGLSEKPKPAGHASSNYGPQAPLRTIYIASSGTAPGRQRPRRAAQPHKQDCSRSTWRQLWSTLTTWNTRRWEHPPRVHSCTPANGSQSACPCHPWIGRTPSFKASSKAMRPR